MSEPKCIEGKFCGKRMLEDVSRSHGYRPIRFIAHNVKYDFQFLYEHLYQVSKIQRGSMLLSARAEFYVDDYKVKFNFVDSYSFIATKLSAFPKMFGFQGVKEIMPYSLWNSDTVKERIIKAPAAPHIALLSRTRSNARHSPVVFHFTATCPIARPTSFQVTPTSFSCLADALFACTNFTTLANFSRSGNTEEVSLQNSLRILFHLSGEILDFARSGKRPEQNQ